MNHHKKFQVWAPLFLACSNPLKFYYISYIIKIRQNFDFLPFCSKCNKIYFFLLEMSCPGPDLSFDTHIAMVLVKWVRPTYTPKHPKWPFWAYGVPPCKTSALDPDPDPDPWIRPFLAGSGSAELRIQMRIQWSDNFNGFLAKFWVIYFFEVWKSVQWFKSYDFFHWIQILGQKIVIFCKL